MWVGLGCCHYWHHHWEGPGATEKLQPGRVARLQHSRDHLRSSTGHTGGGGRPIKYCSLCWTIDQGHQQYHDPPIGVLKPG